MSRIVLVTGAAGMLGSHICRQLLEKGEKMLREEYERLKTLTVDFENKFL